MEEEIVGANGTTLSPESFTALLWILHSIVTINRIVIPAELILYLTFIFFFLGIKKLPSKSEMMSEIAKVQEELSKR